MDMKKIILGFVGSLQAGTGIPGIDVQAGTGVPGIEDHLNSYLMGCWSEGWVYGDLILGVRILSDDLVFLV